jgi:integrase
MYAMLFGLLAATGMRIVEALALQIDDVIADGLVVQETKFQKSRLLPLHATARLALERFLSPGRGWPPFGSRSLHIGRRPTAVLQHRARRLSANPRSHQS